MIDWPYVYQFLSSIFVTLAIVKNNNLCFIIFIVLSFIAFVVYPCKFAYEEDDEDKEDNKSKDD